VIHCFFSKLQGFRPNFKILDFPVNIRGGVGELCRLARSWIIDVQGGSVSRFAVDMTLFIHIHIHIHIYRFRGYQPTDHIFPSCIYALNICNNKNVLHFKATIRQRRLMSKLEAKFRTFWPTKIRRGVGGERYEWSLGVGPVIKPLVWSWAYDQTSGILLTGRLSVIWEIIVPLVWKKK